MNLKMRPFALPAQAAKRSWMINRSGRLAIAGKSGSTSYAASTASMRSYLAVAGGIAVPEVMDRVVPI